MAYKTRIKSLSKNVRRTKCIREMRAKIGEELILRLFLWPILGDTEICVFYYLDTNSVFEFY